MASNTRSGGFGGAGGLGFGKGVGDLFGGGSGTEGAGAARTDSFGARSGEVNPLGSEDPNDYFTRLGIADDIFKIVERRYRNKAVTWVRSQAEGVSARSRMP